MSEALRLADALDNPPGAPLFMDAAVELRRLHEEVRMLQEQNTYLDRKLAARERRLTDDEIAVIWFHARLPGVTETAARMLIRAAEGKLRDIA